MDFIPFDITICDNDYEVNFNDMTIINKRAKDDYEDVGISISFPDYLIEEINNTNKEIIPYIPEINEHLFVIPDIYQPNQNDDFGVYENNNATIPNMYQGDEFSFHDDKLKVFAMSYNMLRIMSGMAGLSYSN